MTTNGRIQVNDLQNTPTLRPAPIQSDTYAAPARAPQDNNLARLADALGSFSSTIGNLGLTLAAGQKKSPEDKKREAWMAERKWNGMTQADIRKHIDEGGLPVEADVGAQAAARNITGSAYGAEIGDGIRQHLMTDFDWDHDDPNKFIVEQYANVPKEYLDDPNFGAAVLRSQQATVSWALDYAQKRKSAQFTEDKKNAAFVGLTGLTDKWITEGKSPEEVAQLQLKAYSDYGKDGVLGVNYDDLDTERLNIARRIAPEHPEVAAAILGAVRKGRNGQDLSLSAQDAVKDEVFNINRTIAKAKFRAGYTKRLEEVSTTNRQLFNEGRGSYIQDYDYTDENGTKHVLSAERQRQQFAKDYIRESRGITAKTKRESVAETDARELQMFSSNGMEHPIFQGAINGLAKDVTPAALADPARRDQLISRIWAARVVREQTPNAYSAYGSEADRQMADDFWAMKQGHRADGTTWSDDDALRAAMQLNAPGGKAGIPKVDFKTLDKKLDKLGATKWFGTVGMKPNFQPLIRNDLYNQINRYIGVGMTVDDATKTAVNEMQANTHVYRGTLLHFDGMHVPNDVDKALDHYVDGFIKQNGDVLEAQGLDASDITVQAIGSRSLFRLVDSTGVPVHDKEGHSSYFSLDQVRQWLGDEQKRHDAATLKQATFDASVAAKGLVQTTGEDGKELWFNPKTRQVFKPVYNGKSETAAPAWKPTGERYNKALTGPVGRGVNSAVNSLDADIEKADQGRAEVQQQTLKDFKKVGQSIWDWLPSVEVGPINPAGAINK